VEFVDIKFKRMLSPTVEIYQFVLLGTYESWLICFFNPFTAVTAIGQFEATTSWKVVDIKLQNEC